MNLEPVLRYPFRGELHTLAKVREKIEDELGAIVDRMGVSPRDRLKVHAAILENREAIVALLSITHGDPCEPVSIFQDIP